ncbi:MAG: flavodoxin [Bacteroidales bacterium]|jgi:flavodoxin long chain|nr:flavodoxin [Bacteroidales bacterium]
MKKTVLVYWPKKGNVENTANRIANHFDKNAIDVFTISELDVNRLADYDLLIFGGSTIGADNWEDAHTSKWYVFFEDLKKVNLDGKTAAIYGLGDQILYPENFVDGMVIIRDELIAAGASIIGQWPVEGYEHTGSKSEENGYFIGLALDDDQQAEQSPARIEGWVGMLKKEMGL